jgi:hypothetical protein
LHHEYKHVAHDVLWYVVRDDLPRLEKVCRKELARESNSDRELASEAIVSSAKLLARKGFREQR